MPLQSDGRNQIMVPPMGLFSLAGWLKRQGHQVEILHAGLSPRPFSIVDEVACRGVRAVFFALHWTRQIRPGLEAAAEIKAILPGVTVVLGGFTASFFARDILENFPAVDAVVHGDGELPAERLSEQLEKRRPDFSRVPNLLWRKGNRIVENRAFFAVDEEFSRHLDHACFELLENRPEYFSRLLYADFDTESEAGRRHAYRRAFFYNPGKGCPGRCTYCGASWWAGKFIGCRRRYYFFPPEKVLADLEKAWRHGARTWRVSFDPDPRRSYYLELFSRLRARGLGYRLVFDCFALPDAEFEKQVQKTFTPDSVLVISAECGSERVRRLNRSFYFSNRELIEALRLVGQCGLQAHVFFSAGLPFETRADIRKTAESIKKLKDFPFCGVSVCPTELDPGAPAFLRPAKFGLQLTRKNLEDFRTVPPLAFRPGYLTGFFTEGAITEAIESLTHVARA
jgi:radical SAM superfamily enzyme YgiQ (UPF0313 family)